jgi:hypothetical protein
MRPSTTRKAKRCKSSQRYMASKSRRSKQWYTTFEGCKTKHYYKFFLPISFLFNFLVVNPIKHNNEQVFHLDFTSTLKIGQSQLPILLVGQGHVKISNLSMLLLLCHLSFYIYCDLCPPYKEKSRKHHVFWMII